MEVVGEGANEESGISAFVERRRWQEVVLVREECVNSYTWRREPVDPPSSMM